MCQPVTFCRSTEEDEHPPNGGLNLKLYNLGSNAFPYSSCKVTPEERKESRKHSNRKKARISKGMKSQEVEL
jgi:hypothetical protein